MELIISNMLYVVLKESIFPFLPRNELAVTFIYITMFFLDIFKYTLFEKNINNA